MTRHLPTREQREIESMIEGKPSRPTRGWEFTGSPIPWTIGFIAAYIGLVALTERWLEPVGGQAIFAPATGLLVGFGIVFGRRAALPIVSTVVLTELVFRQLQNEPLGDGLLVALGRLVTTFVALAIAVRVEHHFWQRPAIRTATFSGGAIVAAAAGAPFACWALQGQTFSVHCAVWTGANAMGIVLVASGVIAALQLRPWHSADRWTRLAGAASLIGAVVATGLAVGIGSPTYLLIAFPLVILAAATADVRLTLATAIAIAGFAAWAQAEGQSSGLDLGTSPLGLVAALSTLAMVTTMTAGITLEHRLVGNELSAIIDALPGFGATVDKNYTARRFMIPRKYREQGLEMPDGISLRNYLHPDDIDRAHAAIDAALAGESSDLRVRVNLELLGPRVFDVNVARVSRWRALILANDVTETQALERERNWEAARYRAIAQSSSESLAEVDLETELVVYANQNWADTVGVPLDQVIGRRLSAPLDDATGITDMRRRLRRRKIEPFEFSFVHSDGSRRWVLVRAARSHHPDGGGSLLVLGNDITLLRETERRRLKIENELTMVEQTERERFAKALHSSPIQMLTAVGLQLGALQGADPNRSEVLSELERVVGESIVELREIMGSLVPPDASAGRIVQSLEHYLDRIGIDRARVTFSDLTVDPPRGQTGIAAFGIAREALMNALLHSGAAEITVRLTESENFFRIEVDDDGIGFDLESSLGETGHLGLRSLFEYATPVGGHCELNSPAGGGTRVRADLPKQPAGGSPAPTSENAPSIVDAPTTHEATSDRYATPSEFR